VEGSTSSGRAGRTLCARARPNPGTAPQSRPSRCCQLNRGVAANGGSTTSCSCIATAPPALPGGPSSQPAVPPACTRVPMVTTPRQGPELVKRSVTVRSGQLRPAWPGRRAPAAGRGRRTRRRRGPLQPRRWAAPPAGHPLPSKAGRRGRAAECTCLENRSPSRDRGFKSLRLRSFDQLTLGRWVCRVWALSGWIESIKMSCWPMFGRAIFVARETSPRAIHQRAAAP
jgi:hypothetical protein